MIIKEIKRRVANGDDLETASGAVLDIMQAAAAEERAKIVALLHEHLDNWCKEETESGDIKHQYHQGSNALERLLLAIEAGEHLK